MTNLLELPAEVVSNVIHQLVLSAGVQAAWPLRSTCRTFAAEIQFDVFAKQPHTAIARAKKHPVEENLWLYLFFRSKVLLDANPWVPEKVNEAIQWLCQERGATTLKEEDDVREIVCKTFAQRMSSFCYLELTDKSRAMRSKWGEKLCSWDKLVMAVDFNDVGMFTELLTQCTGSLSPSGTIFEDFLHLAVIESNIGIVEALAQYLDACDTKPTSNKPVIIAQLLIEVTSIGATSFKRTISCAMTRGNVKLIDILVSIHHNHVRKLDTEIYVRWLMESRDSGKLSVMKYFCTMPYPHSAPPMPKDLFRLVLQLQCPMILTALLGPGRLDAGQAGPDIFPLIEAMELGDTETVRIMLDAGAHVNGYKGGRSPGRLPFLPLQYAVNSARPWSVMRGIVNLLIERGAQIADLGMSQAGDECYYMIRELKIKSGDWDLPLHREIHLPSRRRRQEAPPQAFSISVDDTDFISFASSYDSK
ncbi:hypothetical protein CC80DRAFT_534015 [Byssothecium circinans]|uniref:Uncharacterized protein n=1 Tax=Byssothecium circinans TaxID=147558 RepID=A0A6A5TZA7_9PLEO|nr:hypothetical protein CC80DRAFT_534015 [Byssothecium circinans]